MMGKPSNSKRGFKCPSFRYVAHALAGEPFTVAMLRDCWTYLYPKQAPSRMQIAMLMRGDAMEGLYLVEHYSSRSRSDFLGRNSIYAVCDQWLAENPI